MTDAILRILQTFQAEAEWQTGKQLKRMRLDMDREWFNNTWETYQSKQGLEFEFTALYVHQQNGTVEQSMRTLLDGAHTILAELALQPKYWANAVQTTVYVCNFLPNSWQPDMILAEL